MARSYRASRALVVASSRLLGVQLLAGALVGPLYYSLIHVAGFRSELASAVEALAAGQRDELVLREAFLSFDNRVNRIPDFANASVIAPQTYRDRRMLLAGWQADNGNFIIRGMTRPSAMQQAWLPALLLEHELDARGRTVRQAWVETQ